MATATAGFRAIHAKSIKALAWLSLLFALAVSAMLPATFVGDWTRTMARWIPAPWGTIIAVIILVVGLIAAVIDVWIDLEPNQIAVYYTLALGCIASTLTGGIATWFTDLSHWALSLVDQWLFSAAPAGLGSTALAVAAAVAVIMMTNRVVAKKGRRA